VGFCIVFSLMPCVLCRQPAKQDNEECSLVKMVLSTVDVPAKFTLYNVKTRALRGVWVACGVWRVACGVWRPLLLRCASAWGTNLWSLWHPCPMCPHATDETITPKKGWGGPGVLGLVARYDAFALDADYMLQITVSRGVVGILIVGYKPHIHE
jgi:hypothetical protein